MNAKTWIPLGLAVALGLTAALIAQRTIRNRSAPSSHKTVSIAVAKTALAPGAALGPDDVALTPMPGELAPAQTFSDPGELLGRVTSAPMVPGQAFVNSLLAPKGTLAGLEALVPQGMRAITVDVSESGGMAGLIAPGSHIDVVATSINRDAPDKTITRTIVQNLTVAAVGQRMIAAKAEADKDIPVARTVTLLATPHDAQTLDLALSVGRVRLVMRASGDRTRDADEGVVFAELRGGVDSETATAPSVAPTAVASIPATQPAVAEVSPPTPRRSDIFITPAEPATRIVTVILGNEERRLTFQEPTPVRATDFTDLPQQHAIPN
jgi:pilus assembly protein CpaB